MPLQIVLGNRAYSSWSMRPWLCLTATGAPFDEKVIPLYEGDFRARIAEYAPATTVPILCEGTTRIWESLAICEFLAERFPSAALWPEDPSVRAFARSVAHEMHGGFTALRAQLPMNLKRPVARKPWDADAQANLDRVLHLWNTCRNVYGQGGDYLFGHFSIADAMYAPVATRLRTYDVPRSGAAARYCDAILGHDAVRRWTTMALEEPWTVAKYD